MNKRQGFFGLLFFFMLLSFLFFACSKNKGGFTLTGIPSEYENMYAFLFDEDEGSLIGAERIKTFQDFDSFKVTLPKISKGKVSIPLWYINENNSFSRYSGNHSYGEIIVIIIDKKEIENDDWWDGLDGREFTKINFVNGNATRNWSSGGEL